MNALRLARERLERGYVAEELKRPIVEGNLLIGLTIEEAEKKYPGIDICVTRVDGEVRLVLSIYCVSRHIVCIEGGVITEFVGHM